MPLRIEDADKSREAAMESALAQGIKSKDVVFSGERVIQKTKIVFQNESRTYNKNVRLNPLYSRFCGGLLSQTHRHC